MVLAAGAATFIVLTLLLRLLEKIPPIPEKEGPGGSPLDAPFALIAAFLFLAWMPFFLVFYPGTGMNDTTDIMRAGIWAAGQHTFIYCMAVYGPTELSKELTGSASYGLAFISDCQYVVFQREGCPFFRSDSPLGSAYDIFCIRIQGKCVGIEQISLCACRHWDDDAPE